MSKLFVDQVDPKTATTLTLGTSGDTITVPSGAELKSNKISPASGTAFTLGDSGDTFTIPAGATIANSGTATGFGGDNTPYFQVYKSGDQTISDNTFTTVTFDQENYDSGGNFASNTFTAPSTGYYFIYSQLVWSGTTNSDYSLNRLMKNGSPINWNAFFQTYSSGGFGGRVVHLTASDTVLVQCYQNSGGNLDLRGSGEDECQFGGYKLIT